MGRLKCISAVMFLSIAFFFLMLSSAFALEIDARAAILIDARSGAVLYQKNAEERMPQASLTKIMTALLLIEQNKLADSVRLPDSYVNVGETGTYLIAGETISMESLLYALLLKSANDSAQAIAIGVSGTEAEFVKAMNARAESLGLKNTHYTNPHGLHDENHYSSAADIAVLTRDALGSEVFSAVVSTKEHKVKWVGSNTQTFSNINQFLSSYEGATGVKTGFTSQAGSCLAAAATRGDTSLIAVILNSDTMYTQMSTLMDYGFENYYTEKILEKNDFIVEVPVNGGKEKNVRLVAADDFYLLRNKTDQFAVYQPIYEIPPYFTAPIIENEIVGSVIYLNAAGKDEICEVMIEKSVADHNFGSLLKEVIFSVFSIFD